MNRVLPFLRRYYCAENMEVAIITGTAVGAGTGALSNTSFFRKSKNGDTDLSLQEIVTNICLGGTYGCGFTVVAYLGAPVIIPACLGYTGVKLTSQSL